MYAFIISLHERLSSISRITKRKHLKTSTIREDGKIDIHKLMKSAHFLDDIRSWTEHQVIRITEHDLCFHLSDSFSRDSLNGRSRTDRHKNRGFDFSVGSFKSSRTSESIGGIYVVGEHDIIFREYLHLSVPEETFLNELFEQNLIQGNP